MQRRDGFATYFHRRRIFISSLILAAECLTISRLMSLVRPAGGHLSRCLLISRSGTTWGASAKTLRISTQALVFPAAEYCAPVWSRSPHVNRDRNKEKILHVRRTCDHVRLTCPPICSHVQKIMHRSTQNYKFRKTGTILNYFKIQQIVGRCCFM